MDRKALLIYLHDLRDLEVAKYQILKMINANTERVNEMTRRFQNEIAEMQKENYKVAYKDYDGFDLFMNWLMIVGGFSMIFFAQVLSYFTWLGIPIIDKILVVIGILCVLIFGRRLISDFMDYKEQKQNVKKHNEREKARLENTVPIAVKKKTEEQHKNREFILAKNNYLKNELQKVKSLLTEAYNYNILASSYRNLASVYYIYEYMSTSQASLEDTLIHEHMENGIKRIESKLDIIIKQNEEIIFSMRQLEANTQKTIQQTTEMLNMLQKNLESQQRTEQSALEAAQYAAISATYSRTTAFFSAANYLKKGYIS